MASDQAQHYVTEQLKGKGASLFAPVVGADDVHLAVRGDEGQYVEILVKAPAEAGTSTFKMDPFRPKPYKFIVGVTFGGGQPSDARVLPSGVFERFADGYTLDLDADDGGDPLRERLSVYKNRWQLVTDYRKFRSALTDPVALKLMIALG